MSFPEDTAGGNSTIRRIPASRRMESPWCPLKRAGAVAASFGSVGTAHPTAAAKPYPKPPGPAKRVADIVYLNCTLEDASLVPPIRKPFDVLAEGLVSEKSRGDKTAIELFIAGVRGWEEEFRRQLNDGRTTHFALARAYGITPLRKSAIGLAATSTGDHGW